MTEELDAAELPLSEPPTESDDVVPPVELNAVYLPLPAPPSELDDVVLPVDLDEAELHVEELADVELRGKDELIVPEELALPFKSEPGKRTASDAKKCSQV